MVNSMKSPDPFPSDLKAIVSVARTRKTKLFAYGFVFVFVACTTVLAFNPSTSSSSPWFNNLFSSSSTSTFKASIAPYRSQVSSLFTHFFPNLTSSSTSSNQTDGGDGPSKAAALENGSALIGDPKGKQTQIGVGSKAKEAGSVQNGVLGKNQTDAGVLNKNQTVSAVGDKGSGATGEKQGKNGALKSKSQAKSGSDQLQGTGASKRNQTASNGAPSSTQKELKANSTQNVQKAKNSPAKSNGSSKSVSDGNGKKKKAKWIEDMIGCDLFRGHWVKDDSYPLYPAGSCPHIDEPFNCYLNGRQDKSYQKLRWKPDGCNIPR